MRDQRDPEKLGQALLGLRRLEDYDPVGSGPTGPKRLVFPEPPPRPKLTMSQIYDKHRSELERVAPFKEGA